MSLVNNPSWYPANIRRGVDRTVLLVATLASYWQLMAAVHFSAQDWSVGCWILAIFVKGFQAPPQLLIQGTATGQAWRTTTTSHNSPSLCLSYTPRITQTYDAQKMPRAEGKSMIGCSVVTYLIEDTVGTPKYVANKMKSKGLQRLRWYCQVCEKQCRDENGFKCHAASESHLRQMLVVGENASSHIQSFSSQFQSEFVAVLSRR